jgi:hypothetical protein
MPDCLATASATLAQAPRFSSAATDLASRADHDRMANAIRALAMDAVEQAKSGHPGLPMGAADIATVLFTRFLKFDPTDPAWSDRDRFVLSAGHGSMLLYALFYLLGYVLRAFVRFAGRQARSHRRPRNRQRRYRSRHPPGLGRNYWLGGNVRRHYRVRR